MKLIRSEILKLRTTNSWWLFGIGVLGLLALSFFFNALQAYFLLNEPTPEGMSPQDMAQFEAMRDIVPISASLLTSGQFFGVMFAMLLGIVLITSEFQHQTLTTTFLTTPHRSAVVVAKLVVAAFGGVFFWAITTLLTIPATVIFLNTQGKSAHLGDTDVLQAIALNLLAYGLWGIFGLGIGVLIRSQIGATVTAIVLYLAGFIGAIIVFALLAEWWGPWVSKWQVIVPSIASQLMVSGTQLPGNPPQWVGAAVLIGYAVVAGTIGTLLLRRRDIS